MKVVKEFKIRECEPSLAEFIEDRKNEKVLELKALSEQSEEQEILDYRYWINNLRLKQEENLAWDGALLTHNLEDAEPGTDNHKKAKQELEQHSKKYKEIVSLLKENEDCPVLNQAEEDFDIFS